MANVRIVLLAALALGASLADSVDAAAQPRRTRPYIEIRPDRLGHRECVDGYRQVWRPGWGTYVVMPYMRCWWVRG